MEMTEDNDIQTIQMKAELDRGLEKRASLYTHAIVAVIDAADLGSEKHSFHPFPCDFSISGFLKWLSYDPCRGVILQKQDICLSDVEDKRVAGLNDFSSLKECKCCLGGGGFCDLVLSMLSALPLHRMPTSIAACFTVLKPGGLLLFRDYGIIVGSKPCPTQFLCDDKGEITDAENPDFHQWNVMDQGLITLINSTLSSSALALVIGQTSSQGV
ncbi:unnamed protein product [Camellia sinensis]